MSQDQTTNKQSRSIARWMSSDFRLLRHGRLSEADVTDSSKFVLANGWPIRDVVVRVAGQLDSSRFQRQIRKKCWGTV
jgi:hypothetical protein